MDVDFGHFSGFIWFKVKMKMKMIMIVNLSSILLCKIIFGYPHSQLRLWCLGQIFEPQLQQTAENLPTGVLGDFFHELHTTAQLLMMRHLAIQPLSDVCCF